MDQFHNRYVVYDDVSSAGNHFFAYGKLPDQNAAVFVNGSWTESPHSGATAIQCIFTANGDNFGGFYFQNGILPNQATAPITNFGTVPNAGVNLAGAKSLTFWARGKNGGERIDFFMGGVGRNYRTGVQETPYPDSVRRLPEYGHLFQLTSQWQPFSIDLAGADLRTMESRQASISVTFAGCTLASRRGIFSPRELSILTTRPRPPFPIQRHLSLPIQTIRERAV